MSRKKATDSRTAKKAPGLVCGLCGKSKQLVRTECCGNVICDDEDNYVLFSYARNSCSRNHRRFTVCGYHSTEGHDGDWRKCKKCRTGFETEMYVYYGTNEHNFTKLENPPSYTPTCCAGCRRVIRLATDAYTSKGNGYYCTRCSPVPR